MRSLRRFLVGFAWGLLATVAMTLYLAFGEAAGFGAMPEQIPVAVASKLLGFEGGALLPVAFGIHFGVGAVSSGIYALLVHHSRPYKGLALGCALWLVLQLAVLPWLGWGVFGLHVNSTMWLSTLIAHLIYGVTAGAFIDRPEAPRLDIETPHAAAEEH